MIKLASIDEPLDERRTIANLKELRWRLELMEYDEGLAERFRIGFDQVRQRILGMLGVDVAVEDRLECFHEIKKFFDGLNAERIRTNVELPLGVKEVLFQLYLLAGKIYDHYGLDGATDNRKLAVSQAAEEEVWSVAVFERQKEALLEGVRNGNIVHPILLLGPTGSGKSRFARKIWEAYKECYPKGVYRDGKPIPEDILTLDPAVLSGNNAAAELFGCEAGTFTGVKYSGGAFSCANRGVLFLDEIGDLSYDVQISLKRVLQPNSNNGYQFMRLGGVKPECSNLLIIAATCKDLPKMARDGTFEKDLFARFRKRLTFPALNLRPEVLLKSLPQIFEMEANRRNRMVPVQDDDAVKLYSEYICNVDLPENFRSVENFVGLMLEKAPGRDDVITVDVVKRAIVDFEQEARSMGFVLCRKGQKISAKNLPTIPTCERNAPNGVDASLPSSGPVAKYPSERVLGALKIRLRAHSRRDVQYIRIMSFFVAALARDGSAIQKDVAMSIRKEIDQRTPVEAIQWSDERFRKFEDESGDPLNWGRLKALVAANADTIKSLLDKGDAWIG